MKTCLEEFESFVAEIEERAEVRKQEGSSKDQIVCYQDFETIVLRRKEKNYTSVAKILGVILDRIDQRQYQINQGPAAEDRQKLEDSIKLNKNII